MESSFQELQNRLNLKVLWPSVQNLRLITKSSDRKKYQKIRCFLLWSAISCLQEYLDQNNWWGLESSFRELQNGLNVKVLRSTVQNLHLVVYSHVRKNTKKSGFFCLDHQYLALKSTYTKKSDKVWKAIFKSFKMGSIWRF